jgi:hypothetical protein
MVNLLKWLPALSKKDCNEIVFAMRNFSPVGFRIDPPPYNDISSIMLLNRDAVIAAPKESFSAYGTARVLAVIRTLESEP